MREGGTESDILDQECRAFSRYLTGGEPSDYILEKYRRGHHAIPYRKRPPINSFEDVLVVFAGKGRIRARMGDAYARVFFPHGILRQKLVLLLALLETAPATSAPLTGGGRGSIHAIWSIAASLLAYGLSLLGGLLVLGPMHMVTRSRTPRTA